MQAAPIKPKLKAPRTKRLKLKYDGPLSNFAFNFNLCCYTGGCFVGEVSTAGVAHLIHAKAGTLRTLAEHRSRHRLVHEGGASFEDLPVGPSGLAGIAKEIL